MYFSVKKFKKTIDKINNKDYHLIMRYSKQREAVYNVLLSTKSHPDASWIYAKTREVVPNVSLATVYRNLSELISLGKVKKVSVEGFAERYDANVCSHAHFACEKCGRIFDVDGSRFSVNCDMSNVSHCEITFYGCCDECKSSMPD